MWIVLIIALLALIIALFSLYQITRLSKTTSQSIDSSVALTGIQTTPQVNDGAKDPGIHWITEEYSPVSSEVLWEKRSEFSGKKIELTAEVDTDSMTLQPAPFTGPIELAKDMLIRSRDMWPRNMGKQMVTIQGTFFQTLSIEETGKQQEFYKIVVDSMVAQSVVTREQALQIAQGEAGKESNGAELLKLQMHISESGGKWYVSFLKEGGPQVGGGLPEYVIDAKTGEVLSRLLQR
jgi:hypothetical protein